ncbi:MAG: hypothetical protein JNL73_21430 [Anaerolineales bacterium]|nr:hypothetical protein [Anaerolineales bacterium]
MRLLQSHIVGSDLRRVVDLFGAKVDGARVLWAGDTALVVAEDFSWRTTSNLLLVVTFVFDADSSCTVFYAVGGGGLGLAGLDGGSETNRADRLVRLLQEICRERSWAIAGE